MAVHRSNTSSREADDSSMSLELLRESNTKCLVYAVWCEWEIGLSRCLFNTKDNALLTAKACCEMAGIEDDFGDLLEAGLVGTKEMRIIDEPDEIFRDSEVEKTEKINRDAWPGIDGGIDG